MPFGKRARRRAQREWRDMYFRTKADAGECTCGRGDLPPVWHFLTCPVHLQAMAEFDAIYSAP